MRYLPRLATIAFSTLCSPIVQPLGPDTLLYLGSFTLTAHLAGGHAYLARNQGFDINDAVNNSIGVDSFITIHNQGRYWAFVTLDKVCVVVDTMIVRYRGDKQLDFQDTANTVETRWMLDADFGTRRHK